MELCQTSWPVCLGYIFDFRSDGAMSNILASMSGIYWTLDQMELCLTSWPVCLGYIGFEMRWGYVKYLGQYVRDILDFRSDGAMSNILASTSVIYFTLDQIELCQPSWPVCPEYIGL